MNWIFTYLWRMLVVRGAAAASFVGALLCAWLFGIQSFDDWRVWCIGIYMVAIYWYAHFSGWGEGTSAAVRSMNENLHEIFKTRQQLFAAFMAAKAEEDARREGSTHETRDAAANAEDRRP